MYRRVYQVRTRTSFAIEGVDKGGTLMAGELVVYCKDIRTTGMSDRHVLVCLIARCRAEIPISNGFIGLVNSNVPHHQRERTKASHITPSKK